MREQTAAQHPGKAHERPAFCKRGIRHPRLLLMTLAIKAEDCVPEREDVFGPSGSLRRTYRPTPCYWDVETATLEDKVQLQV